MASGGGDRRQLSATASSFVASPSGGNRRTPTGTSSQQPPTNKPPVGRDSRNSGRDNQPNRRQNRRGKAGSGPKGGSKNDARNKSERKNKSKRSDNSSHRGGGGRGGGGKEEVPVNGNLSHLLGFKYERPQRDGGYGGSSRSYQRRSGRSQKTHNRETFLQANCQFDVKSDADYSIQLVDPDVLVPWENVVKVHLRSHGGQLKCPICLGDPVAAKITRCGHVFCWPCILHHLATSDKKWHTCPLCQDFVYAKDLRSVQVSTVQRPDIGRTVKFNLMRRHKNSNVAVLASQFSNLDEGVAGLLSSGVDRSYFKFHLISPAETAIILDRECEELNHPEVDEADPFVAEAKTLLANCQADTEQSKKYVVVPVRNPDPPKVDANEFVPLKTAEMERNDSFEAPFSDDEEQEDEQKTSTTPDNLTSGKVSVGQVVATDSTTFTDATKSHPLIGPKEDIKQQAFVVPTVKNDDGDNTYMFYQAADGQQLYLHPINIRCLVKEFGSLDNCPDVIEAPIIEMELHTQTGQQSRQRFRYLRHLPVTCEFNICEADLKTIVKPATLRFFNKELGSRAKARKNRQRQEKRLEEQLRRKEQELMAKPMEADLGNYFDFPETGAADFLPMVEELGYKEAFDLSFYDTLSSPPRSEIAVPQPQSQKVVGAWGTKVIAGSPEVYKPMQGDEDNEFAPPSFQASFKLGTNFNIENSEGPVEQQPSHGSKKKKGKKKILFSTTGARHY